MDRHDARVVGRGAARRHRLDHGVDRLVAADAEDRRAEDRVGLAVDHDLDEAVCLALLDRAGDVGHRPFADAHGMARGARLRFAQSHAPERRIDVERVDGEAVAHLSLAPVERFAAQIS